MMVRSISVASLLIPLLVLRISSMIGYHPHSFVSFINIKMRHFGRSHGNSISTIGRDMRYAVVANVDHSTDECDASIDTQSSLFVCPIETMMQCRHHHHHHDRDDHAESGGEESGEEHRW